MYTTGDLYIRNRGTGPGALLPVVRGMVFSEVGLPFYGVLRSSSFQKVKGAATGSRARGVLVIVVSWV
jgi:hypothetical protein